ncbi:MAG: response regulator [Pirellulales bacterium]|nr:response regulator [Pirellulales bacterium]
MARRIVTILLIGLGLVSLLIAAGSGYQTYCLVTHQFASQGNQDALLGARILQRVVRQAIVSDLLDMAALFDDEYTPIEGTDPPQVHAAYDQFLQENLIGQLDAFLDSDMIYYAYPIRADGYVPVHTDHRHNRTFLAPPLLPHHLADHNTSAATAIVEIDGHQYNEYAAPIYLDGRYWGEFRIGIPIALVKAAVQRQILMMVATTLTGSLLLAGITYLVVRRQLRPLRELRNVTGRMADGDLTARGVYAGADELGDLTAVFNRMADTLHARDVELTDRNRALENQITARRRAEEELTQHRDHLTDLVGTRTRELQQTNRRLNMEISERRAVTDALLKSEDKYRNLVERANDGIVIIQDNLIRYANPSLATMLGVPIDEAINRPFLDFIPENERPKILEHYEKRMAGEEVPAVYESALLHRSGRPIAVEVNAGLATHDGRRADLIVFRDITARKKTAEGLREAKEAAEAASRSKSEFLANMSHEIRTPMTAILGYIDLLVEGCPPECPKRTDQIESHVQTISRNASYLLQIINDILDLSKIETGKLEVEQLKTSPFDLLDEVQELMQVRADEKKIPLLFEQEGPLPETIQTDPTRLRQILVNLVGNAIKFTKEGRVRVVSRFVHEESDEKQTPDDKKTPDDKQAPGADYLEIDVLDTGIGMNARQVKHLFEPFTQADTSTTRRFGGTGLGLAISKNLAERLGGSITVQSKQGKGSRFRVRIATGPLGGVKMCLHRQRDKEASCPAHQTTAPPDNSDPPKLAGRILLAEDGPDNQRLIRLILTKAGADVTLAENGRVAVERAITAAQAGKPFDLIFMDMQMPVMDGYAATASLRGQGYAGPIVALTAHAMASDRDRCMEAGCDDYATKPIDRQALLATAAHFLAQSPATSSPEANPASS